MVELERIVTDIDRRVDYIYVQAGMMGADRNELVAEQYKPYSHNIRCSAL